MLQLGVAKELGYTLTELLEKITMEELVLWSVYFDTLNDEEKDSIKRSRYRQTVKNQAKEMPAVANVSVNIVTGPAAAKLKALNGNLKTTNTTVI